MNVRDRRFTVIVTLSALFVGLADLVAAIIERAGYTRLVVDDVAFSRTVIV